MSGANYIHDAAGLMEFDLTVSYEKMVVDNEILGMCQRVLRGIEVSDESLATGLMMRKGAGENFIAERHTVEHMRGEFYVPRLANRDKREDYEPAESALNRARRFVDELRKRPAESRLADQVREAILQAHPQIRTPASTG
jgi:trimethylamine--corrinoid protein Co-methyltransferase